ncbi:MAG: hypothetical protein HDT13_07595 [Butyrivibrio sp.]|nr:hypothetical protein [Butyrivibrio sp.]
MKIKKIAAAILAGTMAFAAMAVSAFAADGEGGFKEIEVVFKVNATDTVAAGTEFDWELAGQLDADFNKEVGEWPAGATGNGKVGEEVTAVWKFDSPVKLAKNYFGLKTNGVAWSNDEGAVNPVMEIVSFKVDGREIAVDNELFKANHTDNDSAGGNLKAVFYNAWDNNIKDNVAIDIDDVNSGNATDTPSGDSAATTALILAAVAALAVVATVSVKKFAAER